MADQDGLRFLFDIQDKITAKLAKIEAKSAASAKKIEREFNRASKAQEANAAKVAAIEQRRVAAAQSNTTKLVAIEQKRVAAVQSNSTKLTAIYQATASKAAAIEQRRMVAAQKATERAVALAKREADARTKSAAKSAVAEQRRIAGLEKAHAKSIKLLKSQADAFKRSMTRLASAAAVAFAAVAAKAISMAGGYDAAMRSVQAKTGATGAVLDKLSDQAREMGRTTVHSATEAARGQAFLAQAGFETHEILEALPATLALATAGELDLASAADIASNVLSGFRMETDQTGRVANVLALAASKTNTSVSQLGAALAKAAPSAAAAGWSLEETTAAIGKLSDAGIQGEEAGTALKTMMARLAIDGGPAEKLMAKMGITVKDTAGKMLPLNDILMELEPHADDVGLQMELLGTRGGNAGLVLGAVAQDARELTGELKNVNDDARKMADIMGGGLWGAIKKIQSIVESAYISLGERFGPAVEKIANLFAKLPAPIQEVIVVVGSLAGAMGGLMLIMPQAFGAIVQLPGKMIALAKSLKLVTAAQWLYNAALTANPIGLVIAAVALLAGGLYLLWKRYKSLQETFDASAATTEDLTDRYDDLTEKVAATEAQLELVRKGAVRDHPLYAKKLRALVAERDELELHIQQRSEAAKWFAAAEKKVAEAVKQRAAAVEKAAKKEAAAVEKAAKKVAKAAKKAADAAKKAAEAAEKEAEAVQDLADSWTGATVKSGRFLKAYKKLTPAQKKNERIMGKVLDKYHALRKVLGPFNKELEEQWRTTRRLNPEIKALEKEKEELLKVEKELLKVAEDLNDRLETQRRRLLNIPTDDAIRDFAELTQTWEGLNDAVKQGDVLERYGELLVAASEAGHQLDAAQLEIAASLEEVEEVMQEATGRASGYELALAGISSAMGGATGQALNLVIAMREHNKAQDAAAMAGGKTEAKFTKMQEGAGLLAFGFSAIGDAIGGTAGKVLGELGNIASAFATGGIVGAIIAGTAALIRGFKSLFSTSATEKAGRKSADAFRKGVRAGLTPEQLAEDMAPINASWDASVYIAVRDAAIAAGATEDAAIRMADAMHHALWRAEKEGPEAVKRVQGQIQIILDKGTSATDAADAAAAAAADAAAAAAQSRRDTELAGLKKHRDEVLGLIETEQDTALKLLADRQAAEMTALEATQSARMDALSNKQAAQLAKLKADQQRELSALASARQAQLSVVEAAIARELEDERIKAQLKIDIRKAGGDREAIDAANARASEATANLIERDELNDMMADAEERIRERYKDELDTINAHWDLKEGVLKTRQAGELTALEQFHADEIQALEDTNALELAELGAHHASIRQAEEQFWSDELSKWTAHFDQKLADMKEAHANELGETITHVETINEATLQLRDRTVTIRTVHVTEHRSSLGSTPAARQHSGGEVGPEIFVPAQSGSSESNPSSGGVDAKAVGRAVADALEGTEIKVDGRKLGRLTVRHQPLAVAELGGRR